ncbi:MAG: membrane protein of unknown function [Candidatus Thorarchaeota archaeon]|nr:MAG: membrane protein of unknown function [Candidatus Thorarchaeota archaeon]
MFEFTKAIFPVLVIILIIISSITRISLHLYPELHFTRPISFLKRRGIVLYNIIMALCSVIFGIFLILSLFNSTYADLLLFPMAEIYLLMMSCSIGIISGLLIVKAYFRGVSYGIITAFLLFTAGLIPLYLGILDYSFLALAIIGFVWVYVVFPIGEKNIPKFPKSMLGIGDSLKKAKEKYGPEFPSVYAKVCLEILQNRIFLSDDKIADVAYARLLNIPGRVGDIFRGTDEHLHDSPVTSFDQTEQDFYSESQPIQLKRDFSPLFSSSWSLPKSEFSMKVKLNLIILALFLIVLVLLIGTIQATMSDVTASLTNWIYLSLMVLAIPLGAADPFTTGRRRSAKYIQKVILSEFVGDRDYLSFPGLEDLEPLVISED